ncbi:MAG: phosphate transport system permease protein [Chloroflexi bacterium]|jgi:phosphate transport system permease protein|nr:MAG: phosphate transport system permease protein [Chloroflexota bacterium]
MNEYKPVAGSVSPNRKRRKIIGTSVYFVFLISTLVGIVSLGVLIFDVLDKGIPWLNWQFLTDYPSRKPEEAGLYSALIGTIWLMFMTALLTVPIGVGAAIYLEEYAPRNFFTKVIEINVSNLAGVPSIVYGLLGMSLFVYYLGSSEQFLGRTLLAGALTLALLVLPIVIMASREAIRAVPDSYRQGAYAMGADKWQVIKGVVLPSALPGILTGTILAMSRAIGEAAPVIAISALVYMTFIPAHPMERFTVLPIQIYNWVARPQEEFRGLAAAGIIVLLAILLTMNAIAVVLRNKYQTRSEE